MPNWTHQRRLSNSSTYHYRFYIYQANYFDRQINKQSTTLVDWPIRETRILRQYPRRDGPTPSRIRLLSLGRFQASIHREYRSYTHESLYNIPNWPHPKTSLHRNELMIFEGNHQSRRHSLKTRKIRIANCRPSPTALTAPYPLPHSRNTNRCCAALRTHSQLPYLLAQVVQRQCCHARSQVRLPAMGPKVSARI